MVVKFTVDLDIPKDIISEALGHKHGSTVTGVYIKYSLDKVDAANRKVIDYFLGIGTESIENSTQSK